MCCHLFDRPCNHLLSSLACLFDATSEFLLHGPAPPAGLLARHGAGSNMPAAGTLSRSGGGWDISVTADTLYCNSNNKKCCSQIQLQSQVVSDAATYYLSLPLRRHDNPGPQFAINVKDIHDILPGALHHLAGQLAKLPGSQYHYARIAHCKFYLCYPLEIASLPQPFMPWPLIVSCRMSSLQMS